MSQNDYKYVTPVFNKDSIEEEDHKAFEHFQKVLSKHKEGLNKADEAKSFVYLLPSTLCGLIMPAEVEEAVRKGDLEAISVSKTYDKAILKVRGKPTLFVPLKEMNVQTCQWLYDGKGQNKETLTKQKQTIENRKRRTLLANRKFFEDLEQQAAEEMLKELERPASTGRARILNSRRTKRAQQYRERIAKFQQTFQV